MSIQDYLRTCNQCQSETPLGYFYEELGLCRGCGLGIKLEYQKLQCKATTLVNKAIAAGQLIRPDTCEICGEAPKRTPRQIQNPHWTRPGIVGHHWRGYEGDAILDLMWICVSCNSKLSGPCFHNGSISKEESRELVLTGQYTAYRQQNNAILVM